MASDSKKKNLPRSGFQCFSNSFHPNFSFLFYFVCKERDAADMLVLTYYSDVSNANLDYVLK